MYYITTDTATQDHEFTDGDELQSIPPTDLNALWFNTVQRELLNILSGMGVAPNASNFGQIWEVLQKIGIKTHVSTDSTVSISNFVGSSVFVHSASNFAISGTINAGSLVMIIPEWGDASGESINVTYGGVALEIFKYNIFVGVALNTSELPLYGFQVPMKKADNSMEVTSLKTAALETSKVIDNNIVSFTYDANDPASYQAWQYKSNWDVGQVKKVYATNDSGCDVNVLGPGTVHFEKGKYKEFVCTGSYTVASLTLGEIVFGTFIVND
jgi:hypothetical protein